jgi:hypothetical protein
MDQNAIFNINKTKPWTVHISIGARTYFRSAEGDGQALQPSTDTLSILRALTPRRGLSPAEATQITERQASKLLRLAGVTAPPLSMDVIAELPDVEITNSHDWPTSGMSRQVSGIWQVIVRGRDYKVRRRFTIAHEFKHILDDPFIEWLYPSVGRKQPEDRAESNCDYFAACLLMPRIWIKRDFANGIQDVAQLARRYHVSRAAMEYRLNQLGLVEPRPRCAGSTRQGPGVDSPTYFRTVQRGETA